MYQTLLGTAVLLSYAGALLYGIREELLVDAGSVLTRGVVSDGFAQVPGPTALAAVLLLAAAGGFLLLLRLGPVSATAAQGYWWLGLPIDRRRALARPAASKMLRSALASGLGFLPVAVLAGPAQGLNSVLLGSAAAAGVGALLFLTAAFVQAAGRKRVAARVAEVAIAVGLLVLLMPLLSGGWLAPVPGQALLWLPSGWPLAVVFGSVWPQWTIAALVLVGSCSGYLVLRLLRTTELTASGSVSGHAAGAIYFGDFRELGQALDIVRIRRRFRLIGAKPASAFTVLVRADVVAFLRSPGKVRNIVVLALIPAAVGCINEAGSAIVIAGVLLASGWAATSASASVARAHAAKPVLDGLLPLTPRQTRRAHALIPAACLSVWSLVAFGSLAVMGVGGPALVSLGVVAGLGLAGAAMRATFQPRPDWTKPGGSTTSMVMPAGVEASFIRGPDFVVLAMLPALVALVSGAAPWWLFMVQSGSSAFCWWWGTRAE